MTVAFVRETETKDLADAEALEVTCGEGWKEESGESASPVTEAKNKKYGKGEHTQ